jgi:hypothetical protein
MAKTPAPSDPKNPTPVAPGDKVTTDIDGVTKEFTALGSSFQSPTEYGNTFVKVQDAEDPTRELHLALNKSNVTVTK